MTFPALPNDLICETCNGAAEGEFYPRLRFSNGATYRFDVPVCNSCRAAATVDDWLTDSLWSEIVDSYRAQGRTPPQRQLTQIEFVPASPNSDPVTVYLLDDRTTEVLPAAKGGF